MNIRNLVYQIESHDLERPLPIPLPQPLPAAAEQPGNLLTLVERGEPRGSLMEVRLEICLSHLCMPRFRIVGVRR